jgi:site-specific DNA recombinase
MAQTKRRASLSESQQMNQAVAIYARVSTEDQAERETVQNQLDFLRRFVALHELPVAGEYVDDGVSGRIPLGDRPEGRRLLIDAESGRFSVVLIYNLKRLGRRLNVTIDAHDSLQRHGVVIRSATESLDSSTPHGKMIFNILGSFNEFDTDERVEVMSLGRDRVARNGHYTGGPIPLGYDLDAENKFIESERVVAELGITEAELVREIFQRVASGESAANGEAARLSALGLPSQKRYAPSKKHPQGQVFERHGHWRGTAIQAILHNPLYKGEGVLDSQYGQITRPAPALVVPLTWQRAQEALLRNRKLSTKNSKRSYLLRGLVRCANCGKSYSGQARSGRRDGQTARLYRCGGQANHHAGCAEPRCFAKALPADWLEDAVWQECRQFILNPGDALAKAQRKLRERMTKATSHDDQRRTWLAELAAKEAESDRVLNLYRRGKISDEQAERELDAIAREAAQLRQMVESLRAQASLVDVQEAFLTDVAAMAGRFREELTDIEATNDLDRKRAFVERYVRQITVESRRVGARKIEADVRVYLRLKPDPITVETTTPVHSR